MDVVTDLARQAQGVVSDEAEFLKQISILFNRIEVMAAMKDEVALNTLEAIEEAARDSGCVGCGNCD